MGTIRMAMGCLCLAALVSCGDGGSSAGGDEFAYCNKKSSNLADYGKCRCLQITHQKSMTREVDECMTNPGMYARGFDGEIPDYIREKMEE